MSDAAALQLQETLRDWIAEDLGTAETDSDGDLTIRIDSARIFIRVESIGDEGTDTTVMFFSPILSDVPRTQELLEWTARSMADYRFGAFYFIDSRDAPDVGSLCFQYCVLGESLVQQNFRSYYSTIGGFVDDLDDELQAKFGGKRFHEG